MLSIWQCIEGGSWPHVDGLKIVVVVVFVVVVFVVINIAYKCYLFDKAFEGGDGLQKAGIKDLAVSLATFLDLILGG